jgi:hypothetical protein
MGTSACMSKDLTTSNLHRQNVLNNPSALARIEEELGLGGIIFDGMPVFTIEQVANILEVDKRTIERLISQHYEELTHNGYSILHSSKLNQFKELVDVTDINVGDIDPRVPQLGIFSFRAFLNISMLMTNGEQAKWIRKRILDIVTQVMIEKVDNSIFVNQRYEEYLPAAYEEENYRKEFTAALNRYVQGNQWKYKHCTDAIYKSIFQERAMEYRKILSIASKDNVRDTFYSELLRLIASYEAGLPDMLEKESKALHRKLTIKEAINQIGIFSLQPFFKPYIEDVRRKMVSRDYSLRNAIHYKLESYLQAMPADDYERFLGERSKALEDRIRESLKVYQRLKNR